MEERLGAPATRLGRVRASMRVGYAMRNQRVSQWPQPTESSKVRDAEVQGERERCCSVSGPGSEGATFAKTQGCQALGVRAP